MTNEKIERLITKTATRKEQEEKAKAKATKQKEDALRRQLIEALGEHAEYFQTREKVEVFTSENVITWNFDVDFAGEFAEIHISLRENNHPLFKVGASYKVYADLPETFLAARADYPERRESKKQKSIQTAQDVFINRPIDDEDLANKYHSELCEMFPENKKVWDDYLRTWNITRLEEKHKQDRMNLNYHDEHNGTMDSNVADESYRRLVDVIPDRQEQWKRDYDHWLKIHNSWLERKKEEEEAKKQYDSSLRDFLEKYKSWKEAVETIRKKNKLGIKKIKRISNVQFTAYVVTYQSGSCPGSWDDGEPVIEKETLYSLDWQPDSKGFWHTTDGRKVKVENLISVEEGTFTTESNIPGTITVNRGGVVFKFRPGISRPFVETLVNETIEDEPDFPDGYQNLKLIDLEDNGLTISDFPQYDY